MQLEVVHARSNKPLTSLKEVDESCTVLDLKKSIAKEIRKFKDVNRQELRLEPKGKFLKDDAVVSGLDLQDGAMLYFKDRGLQIGWTTVFLAEYAGPLLIYAWIYSRPWIFYGEVGASTLRAPVVNIALGCWSFHYLKRLFETVFIHRFSNSTMPVSNLFKNCSYYWGFAAYVAYHVNHPLFTAPGNTQVYSALAAFLMCEFGNLSIHLALRNLRPAGSTVRKIPFPTSNPFTSLFSFVSCPNYTYEIGSWIAFSVMTQCLPAGLFACLGLYQMSVWALGKHRNYKKEFSAYPKGRKSVIPFLF
uniref:very-long-chain enoyl-CoA reductase n=1 Tax=Caligus rogercresseyi TaxID=217165 RepID=C1BNE9_CALRO|nr:Synaptic glycoprotein SC2 [Caligus rogercresseyi]